MEKIDITNITIRDLIRPLFRQKLIIIISVIIITISVYIGLLFQTPVYEAKVLIHIKGVGVTEAQTYGPLGPFRVHLTQMAIVTSNPVIKRAVQALGLEKRPLDYEKNFSHPLKKYIIELRAEKEKEHLAKLSQEKRKEYLLWKAMTNLKENIITELQPNTDIFEIRIRDYDSAKAIDIANVVSRSFTIYDLQQQLAELTLKYGDLHPTIQQLQDNIYKMTNNLNGKEISDFDSIGTASVKIIEQASANYKPVGKPKSLLMLLGILVGGFAGMALAFIFDMLNPTIKSPQEIVQYLNIPTIGTIPKTKFREKPLIEDFDSGTLYVDFYNDLADQMYIFMKVQNLNTLLFVSTTIDTANTAITTNLGYNFSQNMDINTLLIDANITKPLINKILKIQETRGLADMLEDDTMNIDNTKQKIKDKLHILTTGNVSERTAALINEQKVKSIIKKTKNQFDIVLIDCTSMIKLSDVAMLSSIVDGVVIIINEGKDHIQSTRNVLNVLKRNKANVIGSILNNRTFPIPGWLYKRI